MSTLRTDNLQTTDSSFTIAVKDLARSDLSALVVNSVATLRSTPGLFNGQLAHTIGYYTSTPGIGACTYVWKAASTRTDDTGSKIRPNSLVPGCWEAVHQGSMSVTQFGVVAGDDTALTALSNTAALRKAHRSYAVDWQEAKTAKDFMHITWPAGDINGSNGFSVPRGASTEGQSIGQSRFKILNATADVVNVLPAISIGAVIDATGALVTGSPASGGWVTNPPPCVHNLYINPQNSGTALSVKDVAGFHIGTVWIQAQVGLFLSNCGDGIFDNIFAEDSTGIGVYMAGGCQNLMFTNLYGFDTNFVMQLVGANNNIQVSQLQSNYCRFSVISTTLTSVTNSLSIGRLVTNHNVQHGTFTTAIEHLGQGHVSVGTMENYNTPGGGFYSNNPLGSLSIGTHLVRQARRNTTYTQGTTAYAGTVAGGSDVAIESTDCQGMYLSPYKLNNASSLSVRGGRINKFAAVVPLFDTASATLGAKLIVENLTGAGPEGCTLHPITAGIDVSYKNVRDAFTRVTESSRTALKINYNRPGQVFTVKITTNPNPGGSDLYSRPMLVYAVIDSTYIGAVPSLHLSLSKISTDESAGIVPLIDLQGALGVVGAGVTIPYASSGVLSLSLPSTYTVTQFECVSN